MEILRLLLHPTTPVPEKYSKIFQFFHLDDDVLSIIQYKRLFRILTDYDYLRLATWWHRRYHSTPRVTAFIMKDEGFWNPYSTILEMDAVRNCDHCELYTTFRDLQDELPVLHKYGVFKRWHLDFGGPLPNSNGNLYFLLAADYTSNLLMVLSTPQQTARIVVKLFHQIFSLFGIPELLVADNGAPLANKTVYSIAEKANIRMVHSSAYHPRGNSKAERSVQLVKNVLKHLTPDMTGWDSQIFWAAHIVNNAPLMYGYSPRQIAFGLKPELVNNNLANVLHNIRNNGTILEQMVYSSVGLLKSFPNSIITIRNL